MVHIPIRACPCSYRQQPLREAPRAELSVVLVALGFTTLVGIGLGQLAIWIWQVGAWLWKGQ